jgi:hypothetical protein
LPFGTNNITPIPEGFQRKDIYLSGLPFMTDHFCVLGSPDCTEMCILATSEGVFFDQQRAYYIHE